MKWASGAAQKQTLDCWWTLADIKHLLSHMLTKVHQECFQAFHPCPCHCMWRNKVSVRPTVLRTVSLTSIDGLEEWGSREEAEDSITLLTNMSELDPKDNKTLAAVVHARKDNYPELCYFFFFFSFYRSVIILLVGILYQTLTKEAPGHMCFVC